MRRRTKVLIGVGATLVALAGATALAAPWYVKRRIIEEAATRHVTLAVDDVRLRPGSVTLSGVTATSSDVPGAIVTAPSVAIELDGLRPADVHIVPGAKLALDGDVLVVLPALDRLLAAQPARAGTGAAGAAPRLHVEAAAVEWKRMSGANSVARVDGLFGDVASGDDASLAGVFTFEVGATEAGPWPFTYTRDAKAVTTKVVLSPKGEAQASIRFSHAPDYSSTTTDVKVASLTRLVDLGIPEPFLSAMSIEGASVKVDLTHEETATHGKGTVRELQVQGARLRGALSALPVTFTAVTYEGPLQRMPITGGTVTMGPFSGPITGTFSRAIGGVACELAWTSTVMTCADALREQTKAMAGAEVAAGLESLARLLGADRAVDGQVQIHAAANVDTRNLAAARVVITPSAKCDLSFLPR